MLSGAGVGGGSLVYANTLYEPLEAFYQDPSWCALTDWRAELAPYFDGADGMPLLRDKRTYEVAKGGAYTAGGANVVKTDRGPCPARTTQARTVQDGSYAVVFAYGDEGETYTRDTPKAEYDGWQAGESVLVSVDHLHGPTGVRRRHPQAAEPGQAERDGEAVRSDAPHGTGQLATVARSGSAASTVSATSAGWETPTT